MFLQKDDQLEVDEVLMALGNVHDRRILSKTQAEPLSAHELLEETTVPKSTLYRRIDRLEDAGLLEVAATVIEDGHRIERYRCPLETIALTIEDGRVAVDWTRSEPSLREEPLPGPA